MEAANKLMLVKRRLHKMNERPKLQATSFGSHLSSKYSLDAIEIADNMRAELRDKFSYRQARG